ncbi:FeoA family protein [Legionella longbeachae]|uniref:Ferrous iron transporter A n=1 Tax=Legionella longbeachae serogroup 1 (strain NSW150) TaxID=661367 RepID=D3HPA6_LEGLN|nr:FeoA family protein [Legionella longbeachae]VEE01245.1 ferrous iron transporter A [Legionella oakridgensis]HBD7398318.1 ferrous iron transport protein A [Legionella pneumophila]ARB92386.1 ferrous iron transport protein A [Legionella longbeachae]ARM34433.1 ferrous iron transport protein A [Legionella longbeachae]EEZ96279.1 putative ferrous iron transport protein A [Legionella longbeachae D-4968]
MVNITELVQGDKVRLTSFGSTDMQYRRRLLSLGVTCGTEFSVVRLAPLGCPIQIEVRGTALTLRKEEANQLVLEYV